MAVFDEQNEAMPYKQYIKNKLTRYWCHSENCTRNQRSVENFIY